MTIDSARGRPQAPQLDDRSWQDLVDEMTALIPVYAPEWTDRNPSDLGMSLLELFAYLAEGMLYRINQVPEKNYIAFLNLLGITRDPATPAHTFLTFSAAAGGKVPGGAQVQTAVTATGAPVSFETDDDLTIAPCDLAGAGSIGPYAPGAGGSSYADLTLPVAGPGVGNVEITVPAGGITQLALGFTTPVADLAIRFRLYRAIPAGAAVAADWLYSTAGTAPLSWAVLPKVTDGTMGLRQNGTVALTVPNDWVSQRPTAAPGGPAADWPSVPPIDPADALTAPVAWIGLRLTNTGPGVQVVGVERVLVNAVEARTALTIRSPETLGTATGAPFQVFPLAHRPVYRAAGPDPYDHLSVEVGTGTPTSWQPWPLGDTFPDGPGTVCRLDPVAAEVSFGDWNGRTGRGTPPPPGALVRARTYRYVDTGAAGNVAPGTVSIPGTTSAGATLTGFNSVSNLGPGLDGADEEPIADTLRRAPEQLKIRDRAVTADDYEYLAGEATTDLAIVRCLPPRRQDFDDVGANPAWHQGDPWTFGGLIRAPGTVNMIIVPRQALLDRPAPTQEQIESVRAFLEQRRDLSAQLLVTGPRYLPIIGRLEISVFQSAVNAGVDPGVLHDDSVGKIRAFLHPVTGGPSGTGWQVGQSVFSADLFRAVMPTPDVGYVSSIQVGADIPDYFDPTVPPPLVGKQRPYPVGVFGGTVRVADYELVAAAPAAHQQVSIVQVV